MEKSATNGSIDKTMAQLYRATLRKAISRKRLYFITLKFNWYGDKKATVRDYELVLNKLRAHGYLLEKMYEEDCMDRLHVHGIFEQTSYYRYTELLPPKMGYKFIKIKTLGDYDKIHRYINKRDPHKGIHL